MMTPRPNRLSPLLAIVISLACEGCSRDPLEEAAWQASRVGTAAGEGRRGADTVGLETGARVVERFYYVAKYQAYVRFVRFHPPRGLR